jgi:dienelactone hydrolase
MTAKAITATDTDTTTNGADPTAQGAEHLTFESEGETIVGRLYRPAFGDGPAPGVTFLGPETFQKEQAPTQYAERLAKLGFAALVFDPRYRGESGGEPRCFEDPLGKIDDARAALRYLAARADIDEARLGLIGICFGGSYALRAAAEEPLVRAVATVTGHYRDPDVDAQWLGSEAVIAERRARGRAAREKYEATGEVDYVPAVDAERMEVGMPGRLAWSWYQLWADRGLWENRYAVMSDEAVLSYDSISAAARLNRPFLMIHSDQCAFPDAARRHFAVVPTADKRLAWQGQNRHLQYYDDPAVIDGAVWEIADWFARHLAPAP